jgi:DNA-binding MurR/RpiR family transcriptional regulator
VTREVRATELQRLAPSPQSQLLALFTRHRLSPVQRRIARYIVDHLDEAAFLSSVELASRVGVSQPSVTRLANTMNMKGYGELQAAMRELLLRPAADDTNEPNKFQIAVRSEIRNLEAVESLLAEQSVNELGRALADSQPLVVLGFRMSAYLAGSFGYLAAKIHPDVRVVTSPGTTSFDVLSQARQAGASWLVAFLMPRVPQEVAGPLAYAKRAGLSVAAVAQNLPAPLVEYCDEVLSTPVGRHLVFDSHAATVVLSNALLEAMSDAAPQRAQQRLEEYERAVAEENVFLPE